MVFLLVIGGFCLPFLTKIQNRINKKSEKEILLLPNFCMVVNILG